MAKKRSAKFTADQQAAIDQAQAQSNESNESVEDSPVGDEQVAASDAVESQAEEANDSVGEGPVAEADDPAESSEESQNWWTDDDLEDLRYRALPEDTLKRFSSREDYQAATRLADQLLFQSAARTQPQQAPPQQQPPAAPPQPQMQQGPQADTPAIPSIELPEDIDPDLKPVIESVVEQNKKLWERTQQLQQHFDHAQQQEQELMWQQKSQTFDEALDEFGDEFLFGKSGQLTPLQFNARQSVFNEAARFEERLREMGQPVQWDKNHVRRVLEYAVGGNTRSGTTPQNPTQQSQRQLAQDAIEQSQRRMGGSSARPQAVAVNRGNKSPEEVKAEELFFKMQQENGTIPQRF